MITSKTCEVSKHVILFFMLHGPGVDGIKSLVVNFAQICGNNTMVSLPDCKQQSGVTLCDF